MPSHGHNLKYENSTPDGNMRLMISYNSGNYRTLNIKSWEWVQSSANGNIFAEATGGGQAHPNMQPYLTLYMWIRTA